MESNSSMTGMGKVVRTGFGRVMAKVLVLLMAIQVWPLWELSRSYEINVEELGRAASDIVGVAEVWAGPPVANAGADQPLVKNGPLGGSAILNGTGSYDPDGDALTYHWFGPFGVSSEVSPLVGIPEGHYEVSLLVHDGTSFSAVDTVSVDVVPCFSISARSKPGKVQLTWTNLNGAIRYDVYRSHESNPSSFVKIGETTSTP